MNKIILAVALTILAIGTMANKCEFTNVVPASPSEPVEDSVDTSSDEVTE